MKIKFWGTRGSIPTPGPATVKYGGNTSCIQVISNSSQFIVLDIGTGARELGIMLNRQNKPLNIDMFLSHTHSDHICGFPFFEPAFIKGNTINIHGPVHYEKNLADIMASQMDYSYFPVRTAELNAKINYYDLKEQKLKIGDFDIETKYMNHPVLTLGYKIRADNKTIIYTGDTEPYYNFLGESGREDDDDPEAIVNEENKRMIEFVRGADLLICDAQYTEEEYKMKKGWGHSPFTHDLQLADETGVSLLALFHHEPLHSDDDIDAIVKSAEAWIEKSGSKTLKVFAAQEGQEIVI